MGVEWGGGQREPWTRTRVVVCVGACVVLTDQLTKDVWIRWWGGRSELNNELALGIPAPAIGVVIALMVLGLVIVWKMMNPPWAVGLVAGGGTSAMIDRALIGGVQDFIPVGIVLFNVADVAVIVGLVAWSLTRRKGGTHEEPHVQVPARRGHRDGAGTGDRPEDHPRLTRDDQRSTQR